MERVFQWKSRGELFTEKKHKELNCAWRNNVETTLASKLHKDFTKSEKKVGRCALYGCGGKGFKNLRLKQKMKEVIVANGPSER